MPDYGMPVTLATGYADAVERTRAALAEQGFGVLTEIDVAATMKAKLDVGPGSPYLILGARNPPLAYRAITAEASIGLLLPCNVVVRILDDQHTLVEAMDPERDGHGSPTTPTWPASTRQTKRTPAAERLRQHCRREVPVMSDEMRVRHLGGDRFAIDVRGHEIIVDQPVDDGGQDTAPTPTELFVAGLASCVAFYARRYLARHEIDPTGSRSRPTTRSAAGPTRVVDMTVHITPPAALPDERRDAFLAVASQCTVHNTLHEAPEIKITLDFGESA